MSNIHAGSNFDDFLKEEGLLADVEAAAIKLNRKCKKQISQKLHLHRRCIQVGHRWTGCLIPGMFP